MSSLKDLVKKQEDLTKQAKMIAQENVRPALKEAFEDIRKLIPNLKAIRWHQYTPYFNDGDECVFGVHGAYFSVGAVEGGDYDDGFECYFDDKKQQELINTFNRNLENISDMLKIAFGDHAQITLTEKEIEVDEYEHD